MRLGVVWGVREGRRKGFKSCRLLIFVMLLQGLLKKGLGMDICGSCSCFEGCKGYVLSSVSWEYVEM